MLLYDKAGDGSATSRSHAEGSAGRLATAPRSPSNPATVRDIAQSLWRKRFFILGIGLAAALCAVIIGKAVPPRFTSTTQLYLDPRDLQLVDRGLTPLGQDANGYLTIVESQTRVITSNNVLQRVVDSQHLDADPEFNGERKGLLGSLLSAFTLTETRRTAEAERSALALETLSRRVSVRRAERTFIVDVSVWSEEATKAATLANAVAEAYLAEEALTRSQSARQATNTLSARLDELKERVRIAENKVQKYKDDHNLIGTPAALVSDQQLTELNQQLSNARARVSEAQAHYDQIRQSRASATDSGAIPEALNSQTMAALRAQYAELRRRQSDLSNELGPRHPLLRSIEVQARDIRRLIDEEIARFGQSAKNELERAKANEAALSRNLEVLKRRAVETSNASVQLRELEREAEASRAVYQSFLTRSRETGEQEGLNTNNARVITSAVPPRDRSFPPRMSLLALVGLFAGLGLGSGWVLLLERLGLQAQSQQREPESSPARAPQPAPVTRTVRTAPSSLLSPSYFAGRVRAHEATIETGRTRTPNPNMRPTRG